MRCYVCPDWVLILWRAKSDVSGQWQATFSLQIAGSH